MINPIAFVWNTGIALFEAATGINVQAVQSEDSSDTSSIYSQPEVEDDFLGLEDTWFSATHLEVEDDLGPDTSIIYSQPEVEDDLGPDTSIIYSQPEVEDDLGSQNQEQFAKAEPTVITQAINTVIPDAPEAVVVAAEGLYNKHVEVQNPAQAIANVLPHAAPIVKNNAAALYAEYMKGFGGFA